MPVGVSVSTLAMVVNITMYIMPYEVTQLPYLRFRAIGNNSMAHARIFEWEVACDLLKGHEVLYGKLYPINVQFFFTVMRIFLESKVKKTKVVLSI